jgi:hypothetical protein
MVLTIHTSTRQWATEADGDLGQALQGVWRKIQNGKPVTTVLVSIEGPVGELTPVLFNPQHVIAIHEHESH